MRARRRLDVASQEVVDSCVKAKHWRISVEAAVRSMPVVAMEPFPKHRCASSRRGERPFVSPFAQGGLNKAFGLAVCSRSVRTCSNMAHAHMSADLAKSARNVRRPVIGHHAFNANAAFGKPCDCALNKCRSCRATFVFENLYICNARSIIDANMCKFPTDSSISIAVTIAGDSVPDSSVNSTQFLDIDMDKFSGLSAFVTNHRLTRVHTVEPRDTTLFRNSRNSSSTATNFFSDTIVRPALPAQTLHSFFQVIRHRRRHLLGSRSAIGHPVFALKAISLDPFEDRRSSNSKSFGDLMSSLATFKSSHDRQSPALRKLGVFMAHHTTFSPGGGGTSLSTRSPQLPERPQLDAGSRKW